MSQRLVRVFICDSCATELPVVSATRPHFDLPPSEPIPVRWWRYLGHLLCSDCAHLGHEFQRAYEAHKKQRGEVLTPVFAEYHRAYKSAGLEAQAWDAENPQPVPPWRRP